ncbi:MAG: hypothetical protein IPL32_15570 [Chloracidobacterium sp.]|nr:hypothetical protein [Chloracidobacterium sp.]
MKLDTLYSICVLSAMGFLYLVHELLVKFQFGGVIRLIVLLSVGVGLAGSFNFFIKGLLILLKADGHDIIDGSKFDGDDDKMILLKLTNENESDILKEVHDDGGETEYLDEDKMISLNLTDDK